MDNRAFDDLTKAIAAARSRRDVVRGVGRMVAIACGIAGPVGGILWSRGSEAAATCRAGGAICTANGNCCSNSCLPKDATGRQRCACVAGTTPCGTSCCATNQVCSNGTCRTIAPTMTPTRTPTNTPTNTAVPATNTPTNTPTNTAVPATNTPTNTPTNTAVPATNTPTATPTSTARPCLASNAICNPDTDVCCDNDWETICDPSANCVEGNESRCCRMRGSGCSGACDCCAGDACVNRVCCPPLGSQCQTSDDCCFGHACVGNVCTQNCFPTDNACDPNVANYCCQNETTLCSTRSNCRTTPGETRCCHPIHGSCGHECDCCDGWGCEGGQCCGTPGMACASSSQCCSNGTCQDGACCRSQNQACAATDECCAGMTCRGGSCQLPCPLASFACGATCCGNHEHCVNGACTCVPLQQTCDPNNNLCCGAEQTDCPEFSPYGNSKTCCRPQGGHCASGGDCCKNITDVTFGRDSCGDDGVCGGADAYCGTDADCVDGRECIGLCFGIGAGFRYCDSSADCPDIDGNGQQCRQMRCIYRSELP